MLRAVTRPIVHLLLLLASAPLATANAQEEPSTRAEEARQRERRRERRPFLIGASLGMQRGALRTDGSWNPLVGAEVSWNHFFAGLNDPPTGVGVFGSLRYDHRARGVELAIGPQLFVLMGLVEVAPIVVVGRDMAVGVRAGGCLTFGYASVCGHVVYGTHGTFFQLSLLGKSVYSLRPFERYRVFSVTRPDEPPPPQAALTPAR